MCKTLPVFYAFTGCDIVSVREMRNSSIDHRSKNLAYNHVLTTITKCMYNTIECDKIVIIKLINVRVYISSNNTCNCTLPTLLLNSSII